MNEAFPVDDDSRAIPISAENAPCAADGDVPVVVDATPRVYKALPNRSTKSSFMDFFAPRRRPTSGDETVPTYKALTEPPADSDEVAAIPEMLQASEIIETPEAPEAREAPTDQSTKRDTSPGKALTEPPAHRHG